MRALIAAAGALIDEVAAAPLAVLSDEGRDGRRGEIEAHRVHIAEDRPRAGASDRSRRGEEGERAGDDLVARPDLERHQGQQQRIGAGRDADPVLALAIGRDARLQLLDRRAQDEVLARADLLNDRLDLGRQGQVLRLEVEQRDLHGRLRRGRAWTGTGSRAFRSPTWGMPAILPSMGRQSASRHRRRPAGWQGPGLEPSQSIQALRTTARAHPCRKRKWRSNPPPRRSTTWPGQHWPN